MEQLITSRQLNKENLLIEVLANYKTLHNINPLHNIQWYLTSGVLKFPNRELSRYMKVRQRVTVALSEASKLDKTLTDLTVYNLALASANKFHPQLTSSEKESAFTLSTLHSALANVLIDSDINTYNRVLALTDNLIG